MNKKYIKLSGIIGMIVISIAIVIFIDNITCEEGKIQNARLTNIEKHYKRTKDTNIYFLYTFESEDKGNTTLMIDNNNQYIADELKENHVYTVEFKGTTDITKDVYPRILKVKEE